MERLVRVYAGGGALTYLGEGLVRSLTGWKIAAFPRDALLAWHQLGIEVGRGHPELGVPLRIFSVGVRYLMSDDPQSHPAGRPTRLA